MSSLKIHILLLEHRSDGTLGLLLLGWVKSTAQTLRQVTFERITGRQDVGIVDSLNEWSDTRATVNLLLAHCVGNLLRISVDAGNNGVAVRALAGS